MHNLPFIDGRFGGQVVMPVDLERLHKELVESQRLNDVSDETRVVIEDEWPELVYKLPPKEP
jgi:hypothetical protein